MKTLLIIGSGISGLSCALEAASLGMRAIIVSPQPSERTRSVMAAGGINAVRLGGEDSIRCHMKDTLKGGCYLEGPETVEQLCAAAPDILEQLSRAGVVFTRDETGAPDRRAFGGQTWPRTAFSGASTGKQIVSALARQVRRYECEGLIERRVGPVFHSALLRDGVCYGALLFDPKSNSLEPCYADAVVMACGGMNQLFGKTTGSLQCNGYAAGKLLEQGVTLRNLEFVQYHPTAIETEHKMMLISEAARGEGGRLYYLDGAQRVYFMEDKYGPKGNLMPRDIVSRHIYEAPSQVYLDVTFLGREKILSRLREVYDLCQTYIGLDVTKESIPVSPSVHFFMGGIAVDPNHRTNVQRLYAVGECASLYHGANRLGGNSLLAAVYSGQVAARDIAALSDAGQSDFSAWLSDCDRELNSLLQSASRFPAVYLRRMLAEGMREGMGIIRAEQTMRAGLESIEYALSVCDKLNYDPDLSVYHAFRLRSMLTLSKACILSAINRKETRGTHIRSDFPEPREEFRCPSYIDMKDGEPVVTLRGGVCP